LRGRKPHGELYGPDLVAEVRHFAHAALRTAEKRDLRFDVIHAHDWTTFPAALALGRASGKPVVVHVHITEFDKSGGPFADPDVYAIEREGMHGAARVVAVSHFTAKRCREQYGVPEHKLEVVHNAVSGEVGENAPVGSRGPLVLYLGRMTLQKGPDYFLDAAARVLAERPDATFVMAGSGDMLPRLIERAAALGIGRQVLFTGFLSHDEALELHQRASVFVMPSVSEPFGIVPLEALQRGVPVIVSRQSGVSEVLAHALKVDFWDVERLAAQILAALSFPALSRTLVANAQEDLKKLTWARVADRFLGIYRELTH
jgi:glycosyltransferase involved in cell wall biosynthesis